jgi:hypothetical protein
VWTFSRLDPTDSLTEILFGLIMVLTFTLGAAAIAERSTTDPRVLVLAAIGWCGGSVTIQTRPARWR